MEKEEEKEKEERTTKAVLLFPLTPPAFELSLFNLKLFQP